MKYPNLLAEWPETKSAIFTDVAQKVTIHKTSIPSQYVREPSYLEEYEALEDAFAKAAQAAHLSTTSPDTRSRVVAAFSAATTKSRATVALMALQAKQEKRSASYLLVRKQYCQPLETFYIPRGSKQQITLEYQRGMSPTDQANLRRVLGLEIGPEIRTTDEGTEMTFALQVKFMTRTAPQGFFKSKAQQIQVASSLQLKPAIFMRAPDKSAIHWTHTHWGDHKGTFIAYWQQIDEFILERTDGTIAMQATFKGLSPIPIMR